VIAEIEELEEAAEEVRKILVKEEEPICCLLQDNSQARHLSSIVLPRTQPQAITGMQPITITLDPHVLTLFLLGQDLRLGLLLDSTSRAPSGAIPVPNSTYFHSPLPLLIPQKNKQNYHLPSTRTSRQWRGKHRGAQACCSSSSSFDGDS
jgi:hypothetical protein